MANDPMDLWRRPTSSRQLTRDVPQGAPTISALMNLLWSWLRSGDEASREILLDGLLELGESPGGIGPDRDLLVEARWFATMRGRNMKRPDVVILARAEAWAHAVGIEWGWTKAAVSADETWLEIYDSHSGIPIHDSAPMLFLGSNAVEEMREAAAAMVDWTLRHTSDWGRVYEAAVDITELAARVRRGPMAAMPSSKQLLRLFRAVERGG